MLPLVSILIASYNDEHTLKRSLLSIEEQRYKDWELIFIDDCSTDLTSRLIHDFKKKHPKRIKIFRNSVRQGLTKSLNIGLAMARGKYIARLDTDDWWHKEKLVKQVNILEKCKEVIIVGTNYHGYIAEADTYTCFYYPENDRDIRRCLLKSPPFLHSSIMFRNQYGIFYDEHYTYSQDYALYALLLTKGRGINIQDFLTYKTIFSDASISSQKWKDQLRSKIEIRKMIFRSFKHTLFDYRYFFKDFLLLAIPSRTKQIKNKLEWRKKWRL